MNNKYQKYLLYFIILGFMITLFLNSSTVSNSVLESFKIFITSVFPFLFSMMVLNKILIKIGFINIFKNKYIYMFIISILSGAPTNAIIINDLLKEKYIKEKDASLLICFTTMNNPLFLYNILNKLLSNNFKVIKILSIIYILNLITFIIFYNKLSPIKEKFYYKPKNFKTSLMESLKESIDNMILIFATITFFKLICDIFLPIATPLSSLLKGLLEITQGLNSIMNMKMAEKIKECIILSILLFSGFSIHIQISNVFIDKNIDYTYFYISRIIHILIGIFLYCI